MAAFWPPLVTVAEKECMDSMPISENKGVLPLFATRGPWCCTQVAVPVLELDRQETRNIKSAALESDCKEAVLGTCSCLGILNQSNLRFKYGWEPLSLEVSLDHFVMRQQSPEAGVVVVL